MSLSLIQIDSFTTEPFGGNPAAVVLLDAERPDDWLTAVAAEMNLSETAFLLPQEEQWGLRWFTPTTEMDLCGHATLAAAHALWTEGVDEADLLAFATRSGTLTARRLEAGWIQLDFPALQVEEAPAPPGLLEALGLRDAVTTAAGGSWALVQVADETSVADIDPDFAALAEIDIHECVVTASSDRANTDFVSRLFAPAIGIPEDPVTGAAHCVLGPWWATRLGQTEFDAEQISARGGRLRVELDTAAGRVKLAGQAVTVFRAQLEA